MNKDELLKIKENALERHIPIIMDDTLEVIDKYLTEKRPEKILDINYNTKCPILASFIKRSNFLCKFIQLCTPLLRLFLFLPIF